MRNLITDYSFEPNTRTITLDKFANLSENNPFSVENIRLIVNETQKVVVCSSMQKDNIIAVEGNTITYTEALAPLAFGDQLTIEVDMGDGFTYVDSGDWVINAKLDALKPIEQQKEWVLDEAKARQLKPLLESGVVTEIGIPTLASVFAGTRWHSVDMSIIEKINGYYVAKRAFYGARIDILKMEELVSISGNYAAEEMFKYAQLPSVVSFPKLLRISGASACSAIFSYSDAIEFDFPNLEECGGTGPLIRAFEGCNSLLSVRMPKLKAIGEGYSNYSSYLFYNCARLRVVDIRSYEKRERSWANAFSNSHALTTLYISANGLLDTSTQYNPINSATDLTDLYLYGDATNSIYLSWQGSLNFNSVCGVLRKLCKNTDANGLVCSFKSGFSMTDQTSHIYTDGDGNTTEYNEPNGILATLKAQAESQGWTIQNLTIK